MGLWLGDVIVHLCIVCVCKMDLMLRWKQKAEIQSLVSIAPHFLTRVYLHNKLSYGGWIWADTVFCCTFTCTVVPCTVIIIFPDSLLLLLLYDYGIYVTNKCLNVYQIPVAPHEDNFLHTVVAGLQLRSSITMEPFSKFRYMLILRI